MFKIFVGNLGPTVTADALKMLFSRYVDVDDVALPTDEKTGKLRGFAIVMIKDEQKAKAAMAAVRGARLGGRPLIINQARKKGKAPPKREFRRGFRTRTGSSGGGGGGSSSGRGSSAAGGGSGGFGRPRGFGGRTSDRDRPGNRGPSRDRGSDFSGPGYGSGPGPQRPNPGS